MTVNEEIFVGSQANLAFVPELILSGFIDESASVEADGTVAILASFSTDLELVPNLYKGCIVEIFDASDSSSSSMHTITSNTTTTFTISPIPALSASSGAFASNDTDFFHIHPYGAPCPAKKTGANSLRLNADNWMGLLETATFPNTEIEMKTMNLSLGGSRNFSHQYKGMVSSTGGNLSLIANHGSWLYYALGKCSTINTVATGTAAHANNNPVDNFTAHDDGGSGNAFNQLYIDIGGTGNKAVSDNITTHLSQGPIFYRSDSASSTLLPPLVNGIETIANMARVTEPTFNASGVIQNPITYTLTEANGVNLPSFSLEHSIAKTSTVTPTQGSATETETLVRIARGNRVNTLTMTANENEEVKMTMDLNTRTVDYINDLTTTQVYTPRNGIDTDTTLLNYTSGTGASGGLEPFFFSSGVFKCFGQTFLKITALTLTINNNLVDKRYVGIGSKAIKDGIPAQRDYMISFTAMITDDMLFQELLNNTEDLGSTNEILLQFDKDSGEQISIKFEDYFLTAATLTVPEDKGTITVEGTITPRTMSECKVKTHWILQG